MSNYVAVEEECASASQDAFIAEADGSQSPHTIDPPTVRRKVDGGYHSIVYPTVNCERDRADSHRTGAKEDPGHVDLGVPMCGERHFE